MKKLLCYIGWHTWVFERFATLIDEHPWKSKGEHRHIVQVSVMVSHCDYCPKIKVKA